MNETFEQLTKQLDSLYGLPGVALTLMVCLAAGYLFKLWQIFPNKWIPLPVVLFGIGLNIGLRPPPGPDVLMWQHCLRLGIVGFLIGVGASVIYDKLLSKLEEKWPWLKNFLSPPPPAP